MSPVRRLRHGGAADEPPPFGSWRRLYTLVLAVLVVDLIALAWLTERFR